MGKREVFFPHFCRYGEEFIQEAYLYHVTRRDTRHNFSVYFYLLYLIQDTWLSLPVGILAFIPQAVLLLATSVRFHRDVTLCSFVQTFIFVTFNKVCTSQVSASVHFFFKEMLHENPPPPHAVFPLVPVSAPSCHSVFKAHTFRSTQTYCSVVLWAGM